MDRRTAAVVGSRVELGQGCQVAPRPAATTGYFRFFAPLPDITDAVWDADTGIAWYVSPDNQPRSLDDHQTYLADVLNGGKSDGVDYACLTDDCDLELPTLAQLKKLGADCASVAELSVGSGGNGSWIYTGAQADLCAALWPDPTLGEPTNCAWSSTVNGTGRDDPARARTSLTVMLRTYP
jgi:hypothetical protein